MSHWLSHRERRGLEIASRRRINKIGDVWFVPSDNPEKRSIKYRVTYDPNCAGDDLRKLACSCPDYTQHKCRCKHIVAVEWDSQRQIYQSAERHRAKDGVRSHPNRNHAPPRKPQRSYPQNWPAYDKAQEQEKKYFQTLLRDLCRNQTPQVKMAKKGRRINIPDALFTMIYKVYSTVSARRFNSDLELAMGFGYIDKAVKHGEMTNYFARPEMTNLLASLVGTTSFPLSGFEETVAADSTGFTTTTFVSWYDHKYRGQHEKRFVKLHLMCGTRTHIITAAEIHAGRDVGDARVFSALFKRTKRHFHHIKEVCADAGYSSVEIHEEISSAGAQPLINFKSNSTGSGGGAYLKAFLYFRDHQDEFSARYHKRSNIETVIAMLKKKFYPALRSRTETAMINEAYCKVICHNIVCLIHAAFELGIDLESMFAEKAHDH